MDGVLLGSEVTLKPVKLCSKQRRSSCRVSFGAFFRVTPFKITNLGCWLKMIPYKWKWRNQSWPAVEFKSRISLKRHHNWIEKRYSSLFEVAKLHEWALQAASGWMLNGISPNLKWINMAKSKITKDFPAYFCLDLLEHRLVQWH